MRESIHRYMQVGIVHFMAFPEVIRGDGPIAETLEQLVVDEYFDAVEITWISDAAERAKARAMLEAGRMAVAYGAQPSLLTTGLNPNALDEAQREKAEEMLKSQVDEAYEMGASGMAFLAGKYDEATRDQAVEQLIKTTKNACAYARSKGDLGIELETFDFDVDKCALVGPHDLAGQVAAEVRRDCGNFGLLIDQSHFPLQYLTVDEAVDPVLPHLRHVHIGNCVMTQGKPAYGDQHPRYGIEHGRTDVPELAAFLRKLLDAGFLDPSDPPIVSFEVKPWGEERSEVVIANAKRTLNRAWALV